MRKKISALLVLSIALLSALLIPVIHATKSIPASGEWTYTPSLLSQRWADGNLIRKGEEVGGWAGTFVGTSYDTFTVIIHPSGFVTCQGQINFEGTVNVNGDKSGTMVILFIGKKNLETGLWSGKWVIISGTGDLATLNGHGTWEGPGWIGGPDPGELTYDGKIHFDPS